jgi:hypothetical protein
MCKTIRHLLAPGGVSTDCCWLGEFGLDGLNGVIIALHHVSGQNHPQICSARAFLSKHTGRPRHARTNRKGFCTGQLSHTRLFVLGFVGACAPEIVRLYHLRAKPPPRKQFSAFYFLISLVYGGLGGVVALVLPAVTYYGAFYAGVTLPCTFSAMLRNKNRMRPVALANERDSGMKIRSAAPVDAIDTSRSSLRYWPWLVWIRIRNHADGLFD